MQMKEDCHSELSREHKAGRRVRQAGGFSGLFSHCEMEPEFTAAASEEPPGSQGFLDKRPPSRVPSEPLGAAALQASTYLVSKSNLSLVRTVT